MLQLWHRRGRLAGALGAPLAGSAGIGRRRKEGHTKRKRWEQPGEARSDDEAGAAASASNKKKKEEEKKKKRKKEKNGKKGGNG